MSFINEISRLAYSLRNQRDFMRATPITSRQERYFFRLRQKKNVTKRSQLMLT